MYVVTNRSALSISTHRAKANTMQLMFCCYHHSSVSLFSFHIKMITPVYFQNDSNISLELNEHSSEML